MVEQAQRHRGNADIQSITNGTNVNRHNKKLGFDKLDSTSDSSFLIYALGMCVAARLAHIDQDRGRLGPVREQVECESH